MSILIIGPDEQVAIRRAIEEARGRIVPWQMIKDVAKDDLRTTLTLKERNVEILRKYPAQQVMLGTYQVYFSFEEQPAGLMRHLSASSSNKKKVPGLEVMKMIAQEFGFSDCPPLRPGRVWLEEFEKGWRAVNIVELEPS